MWCGTWSLCFGLALLGGAAARAEPLVFAVDAGATAGYDSNIFRFSNEERERLRSGSVDDNIYVPHVAGRVTVPFGLQTLQVGARLARRLHALNTDLDSNETGFAAQLRYQLPVNCSGLGVARQFRRLSDYEDVDLGRRRIVVRDRLASGDIDCAVTPVLRTRFAFDARERVNFDPIQSQYDLTEYSSRGEIAYGLIDSAQPFVAVRFRFREQPNFVGDTLPDGIRAAIWDVGGGVRWSPNAFFTVTAEAAYTHLEETTHRRDGGFFTGAATAEWSLTGKTRLTLALARSLDVSPNIGAIAFAANTAEIRTRWEPTPLIAVTFGARYRFRVIDRDLSLTGPVIVSRREEDDNVNVDAAVDYAITDRLGLRGALGYRGRSANYAELDYRAAVAIIGVTYRFTGPALDVPLE